MSDVQKNLGVLSNKVYELLHELDPAGRARVINSVLQLCGDQALPATQAIVQQAGSATVSLAGNQHQQNLVDAKEFFANKAPKNKGEALAVAARFAELSGNDSLKKDDFEKVFSSARRGFDKNHFTRDIENATRQAGFFLPGLEKGQYQLSNYGQQYIDTPPNRDELTSLERPRRKASAKKKSKKKAAASK